MDERGMGAAAAGQPEMFAEFLAMSGWPEFGDNQIYGAPRIVAVVVLARQEFGR